MWKIASRLRDCEIMESERLRVAGGLTPHSRGQPSFDAQTNPIAQDSRTAARLDPTLSMG